MYTCNYDEAFYYTRTGNICGVMEPYRESFITLKDVLIPIGCRVEEYKMKVLPLQLSKEKEMCYIIGDRGRHMQYINTSIRLMNDLYVKGSLDMLFIDFYGKADVPERSRAFNIETVSGSENSILCVIDKRRRLFQRILKISNYTPDMYDKRVGLLEKVMQENPNSSVEDILDSIADSIEPESRACRIPKLLIFVRGISSLSDYSIIWDALDELMETCAGFAHICFIDEPTLEVNTEKYQKVLLPKKDRKMIYDTSNSMIYAYKDKNHRYNPCGIYAECFKQS